MSDRARIKVIAKEPPGGRCRLYRAFADVLAATLDAEVEVVCPSSGDTHQAPGLMANDHLFAPSDGVILTPDDICADLAQAGIAFPDDALRSELEAVEEKFMDDFA